MAFFHAGNFYPRPPRGGRPVQRAGSRASGGFLSTPSARRATAERQDADPPAEISIHALREEGDVAFFPVAHHCHNFYPRPPRGGRQPEQYPKYIVVTISIHALREEGDVAGHRPTNHRVNFYPRPPRGGRRSRHHGGGTALRISIHALREEGDLYTDIHLVVLFIFLSTPSARRATADKARHCQAGAFLSTPSARRATGYHRRGAGRCYHFYPRPPRGGRRIGTATGNEYERISIHALREEGDQHPGTR